MKTIIFLSIIVSFSAKAQVNILGPFDYHGYKEGARTVHFSDDGKRVFGDWDDLVEWDIESQAIVNTTNIPGYNTNKSAFDGVSFWFNANSNYNSDQQNIMDMHNNINTLDSSGNITSHKTEFPYGAAAIIPGTKDVIVVATSKTYTYQVVRLNTETLEQSTNYFDETRDGAAVPSAIKISNDGKYLAVAFAGENSGLRVYKCETGEIMQNLKTESDANDVAFSKDGNFIFVNDGATLIQLNTAYWRETGRWVLKNTITSLDANMDGAYVAIATLKKGAFIMNMFTEHIEFTLTTDKVNDVTFSNDGNYLALGMQKTLKSAGIASILMYQITY